jgi:hypothetical protein
MFLRSIQRGYGSLRDLLRRGCRAGTLALLLCETM